MRERDNISAIARLRPDFMGFIFAERSPRFVGNALCREDLAALDWETKRVGVFVDAGADAIAQRIAEFDLDMVQLHGSESPELCAAVSAGGVGVIKSFSIGEGFDFASVRPYADATELFLFDAGSGGGGKHFDWKRLAEYGETKPFLLAGGIGVDDLPRIREIAASGLPIAGIDLNSRVEVSAGRKSVELVREVCDAIRR